MVNYLMKHSFWFMRSNVVLYFIALQEEFEQLFKTYDNNIKVNYLKNFKKVRITFDNKSNAEIAQTKLHQTLFHGEVIKVFLIQVMYYYVS